MTKSSDFMQPTGLSIKSITKSNDLLRENRTRNVRGVRKITEYLEIHVSHSFGGRKIGLMGEKSV